MVFGLGLIISSGCCPKKTTEGPKTPGIEETAPPAEGETTAPAEEGTTTPAEEGTTTPAE